MRRFLSALLCAALLAGCSTVPVAPQREVQGSQIAEAALGLLGRPYRYGGTGPDSFDCSGLVHFVHGRLGLPTPRTTAEQFRDARSVALQDVSAGDLLFFRIGPSVSHVGIYAGNGRFVHAPQTGRPVETRAFADPFYQARLAKIGRFY